MWNVKHCQIRWQFELRGAAALTCAQCADHRVVVDGAKTNDAISTTVRDEDFPRRRHHGNTNGILQSAGGSLQLPHPHAICGPQHRHPTVAAIHNEEETFVGGERQATREIEFAWLTTL